MGQPHPAFSPTAEQPRNGRAEERSLWTNGKIQSQQKSKSGGCKKFGCGGSNYECIRRRRSRRRRWKWAAGVGGRGSFLRLLLPLLVQFITASHFLPLDDSRLALRADIKLNVAICETYLRWLSKQPGRRLAWANEYIRLVSRQSVARWSLFRARDEKPISAAREIRRRPAAAAAALHFMCRVWIYFTVVACVCATARRSRFGLMLLWPLAALNKTPQRA